MSHATHSSNLRLNFDFNKLYACTSSNIELLAYSLTHITDIGALFTNKSDFLNSVRVYPFKISDYFTLPENEETIILGDAETLARGKAFNSVSRPVLIASVVVGALYDGNFLNYAPYTKLELYLPFIGFVNLDASVVMGHRINVFYAVDFDTGGVTASLELVNRIDDPDGQVIMQAQGIIGFDMPVGATNTAENARTLIANGVSMVGGIVSSVLTENPLPAIMSGLGTASSLATMHERVTKGGAVSNKGALANPYDVYLIRTFLEPIGQGQDEYKSFKGLPLMEKRKLKNLTGYTKVRAVHVENTPTATETEKQMIEQMLINGVIL